MEHKIKTWTEGKKGNYGNIRMDLDLNEFYEVDYCSDSLDTGKEEGGKRNIRVTVNLGDDEDEKDSSIAGSVLSDIIEFDVGGDFFSKDISGDVFSKDISGDVLSKDGSGYETRSEAGSIVSLHYDISDIFDKTSTRSKSSDSDKTGKTSSDIRQMSPRLTKTFTDDYYLKLNYFFRDARFYVIKSYNIENIEIAKKLGVWSTLPTNETKLSHAFKTCQNVVLIFSAKASGRYSGFARLSTDVIRNATPIKWVVPNELSFNIFGGVFKLDWLCRKDLPFDKIYDLYNPWNANKPIKIARDGQEIEPRVAEKLCRSFPPDTEIDLTPILRKSQEKAKEIADKGSCLQQNSFNSVSSQRTDKFSYKPYNRRGGRAYESSHPKRNDRKNEAPSFRRSNEAPSFARTNETPSFARTNETPSFARTNEAPSFARMNETMSFGRMHEASLFGRNFHPYSRSGDGIFFHSYTTEIVNPPPRYYEPLSILPEYVGPTFFSPFPIPPALGKLPSAMRKHTHTRHKHHHHHHHHRRHHHHRHEKKPRSLEEFVNLKEEINGENDDEILI